MQTKFLMESRTERDHLGNQGRKGRKKYFRKVSYKSVKWLRFMSTGRFSWSVRWTFQFHKHIRKSVVHHHHYKSPLLDTILSHIKLFQDFNTCFINNHFSITILSTAPPPKWYTYTHKFCEYFCSCTYTITSTHLNGHNRSSNSKSKGQSLHSTVIPSPLRPAGILQINILSFFMKAILISWCHPQISEFWHILLMISLLHLIILFWI